MGKMRIEKYSKNEKKLWDAFVDIAKNASFHLKRDFVEYHEHRFEDYSLLIFNQNDELVALLPANIKDNIIYSHQGLTYGGLICKKDIYLTDYIKLAQELFLFLKEKKFEKIIIKEIPWTYTIGFNDDFRYIMNLVDAKIIKFDVLPHIAYKNQLAFQTRRIRSIKKALSFNYIIEENDNFANYWFVLESLLNRYESKPTHTLEEIKNLKKIFPLNIRLFQVVETNNVIAGIVVFETNTVARAQYIASNDEGKKNGALDLLFDYIINNIYINKDFFEFGTSTLNGGLSLNYGLSEQKEGFGARTVIQQTYEVPLKNNNFNQLCILKP